MLLNGYVCIIICGYDENCVWKSVGVSECEWVYVCVTVSYKCMFLCVTIHGVSLCDFV